MATSSDRMMNIVLITIDALRADHLGCYGCHRNTSPNIDKLASSGAMFLQAISNGGGTPEAFPSILAAVLPPAHYEEYGSIIKENVTIAEILGSKGYDTAAFHSNPYLSRFFHYDKGFDTFDDSLPLTGSVQKAQIKGTISKPGSSLFKLLSKFSNLLAIVGPPIIRADQITSKAIPWLREHPNMFFLWLHYMDVHHPYMPPSEFRSQFCPQPINLCQMLALYNKFRKKPDRITPYDRETLLGLYDAGIKYVDTSLGSLLSKLGERLDNTLIIVTADHGEALGEHDRFGHNSLYEEVIRVPLIITIPGRTKGVTVKSQVSSLDIAPTILDILNIEKEEALHGKSLIPVIKQQKLGAGSTISVALNYPIGQRMFSYRTEDLKYIFTERVDKKGKTTVQELYSLKDDPQEERNLYEDHWKKAQQFELKIQGFVSRAAQARVGKKTRHEKERITRKIKRLNL